MGRGLLQDDGVEGVRSLMFGVAAGLLSVGLFLPRHFHRIYLELSYLPDPTPFRQALAADGLFMLTLPFLLAIVIASVVAPAIYPDEVDYLTLVPLPIARRHIFVAKLVALAVFACALLAIFSLCAAVSFPMFTQQRWAEHSLVARVAAHALASATAGGLGFGAVVALQGLMAVWLPRRWTATLSVIVPGIVIASVVLVLPFVLQVPGLRAWIATEPPLLQWYPPAWSLGVERVLLGGTTPYWERLAVSALMATGGLALLVALSYASLFRHFERLVLPAHRPASPSRERSARVFMDMWSFTVATLLRNRLPLLLFLVFLSLGVGSATLYVINGFWTPAFVSDEPPAADAILAGITVPLLVMLGGLTGLRAAFQLPVQSRANWVFRVNDTRLTRTRHLRALDRATWVLVILPTLLVAAPLHIWVFRHHALMTLTMTVLAAGSMCEVAFADWHRVPFTCSWIPGKRPLVFTLIAAMLVFALVARLLAPLISVAVFSWPVALVLAGVLVTTRGALRERRVRQWAARAPQFEDESDYRVQTLGLN